MVGWKELTSKETGEINNAEVFILRTREFKLENVVREGIHIVIPLLSWIGKPHAFRYLQSS